MSNSRGNKRFGFGKYDLPDHRYSRGAAQDYFLHVVQQEYPCVLHDLAGAPFTLYSEQGKEAAEQAIAAWSARWNLTAAWCRERALRTLALWALAPRHAGELWALRDVDEKGEMVPKSVTAALSWSYPVNAFLYRRWTGTKEAPGIKDEIERDFRAALKQLETSLDEWALSNGLVLTVEKRQPSHFFWLARFQVGKESRNAISDDLQNESENPEAPDYRTTLRDALNSTAELLDLPLRSD